MIYQFPPRRELKFRAKRTMIHPASMRATLFVVCLMMAVFGLKYLLNANLTYALVDLNQYKDTATGITFNDNGFSVIFRMDLTQMVLAIPLTYTQIVTSLCFLFLAPLRMGAMEVYWRILRGEQASVFQLFRWLSQIRRLAKAVMVEFILQVGVRLVGLLCTVPSLYLYYLFYTNVTSIDQVTGQIAMLQSLASLLAIAAALLAFWLHSFFLPVRYCLAAHPEYTLGETFRRGLRSMKGYRGRFFRFRLTMLPWFFLSQLSYNALDLFVLPYTSMASMLYVQEAAKERKALTPSPE